MRDDEARYDDGAPEVYSNVDRWARRLRQGGVVGEGGRPRTLHPDPLPLRSRELAAVVDVDPRVHGRELAAPDHATDVALAAAEPLNLAARHDAVLDPLQEMGELGMG
jgi:hypothetical protein